MYEYKYAFHFFKNKIIENDVLLNDIGSISAEASDFECDAIHDDVKAAEKDNALCLAVSQLASEFSKESMLSLQKIFGVRRAHVISTGSLKLDLALGIGGLPKVTIGLVHLSFRV